MKKNKALTAAISVLSLTMVSMCAIGGTFAKYASQGSATDTATVAKWGVNVTVTNYMSTINDTDNVNLETDVVVAGNGEKDIIAPGTSGTMASYSITGDPEVTVDVSVVFDLDLGLNWKLEDSSVYCPLVFTVGSTDYQINGTTITSTAELEAAVEAAVNVSLTNVSHSAVTSIESDKIIKWSWPFSSVENSNDPKDTYLGNLLADGDAENNPTLAYSLSASVTQVD